MGRSRDHQSSTSHPPTVRLLAGGAIFVVGFLSPLLIPLVASSHWQANVKLAVSGLLAVGIPELGILVAVGILGKSGFLFLKRHIVGTLSQYMFPESVGLLRHRIGIIMLVLPLIFGWVQPYIVYLYPNLELQSIYYSIVGDVVFVLSFIVLGGDFWEKLRRLFIHDPEKLTEHLE